MHTAFLLQRKGMYMSEYGTGMEINLTDIINIAKNKQKIIYQQKNSSNSLNTSCIPWKTGMDMLYVNSLFAKCQETVAGECSHYFGYFVKVYVGCVFFFLSL